jgi:mono/diheme cytochrome c family protein
MMMSRIISSSYIVVLVALFAFNLMSCGGGGESKPAQETSAMKMEEPKLEPGNAEQGKTFFVQFCSACHGQDALGLKGLGKDLVHSEFIAGLSDEEMLKYVNEGRAVDDPRNTTGIPMPPKGGNPALTDQQIMHIIAYLRTIQDVPAK